MRLLLLALAVVVSVSLLAFAAPTAPSPPAPAVKTMRLSGDDQYVPLLSGPPETVTMRSGLVTLVPGKSVGRHNTKQNEEIVIVLKGSGEMRFWNGHPAIALAAGVAVYGPPETEHDVVNTGSEPLQYVYVVARTAR
jgi:quercetin dioxygenase-like cupin family protein